MRLMRKKFQAPSSKFQRSSKFQASNKTRTAAVLEFGVWNFFGTWCLELGASLLLLVLVVALVRRASADFFTVLQLAVHGLVAAGNNFLPLVQAFGDLPIIFVADA